VDTLGSSPLTSRTSKSPHTTQNAVQFIAHQSFISGNFVGNSNPRKQTAKSIVHSLVTQSRCQGGQRQRTGQQSPQESVLPQEWRSECVDGKNLEAAAETQQVKHALLRVSGPPKSNSSRINQI
jgi:hypothetical protein